MGIPVMYQGISWANYEFPDKGLEKVLKGYTEHCDAMFSDCVNLLLVGSNGCGKSITASIILQYCYRNYFTARMTTFRDLISKAFANEDISGYVNAEFLVIDELGAEVNLKSSAEKVLLEDLLKQRFAKGFPTIICSNLDLSQLKERYGNTFYSMLSEFVKIKIVGEDKRKAVFRNKQALKYLR